MKRFFSAILFLLLLKYSAFAAEGPWVRAEVFFQAGEFAKGRSVLVEALGSGSLSPVQTARTLGAFALFHERYAGDFDQAVRFYERIRNLDLDDGHPLAAEARGHIKRMEDLDARFGAENSVVNRVRIFTTDREEIQGRVADLRGLTEGSPGYHRLADAYFYLGHFLMELDRPSPTVARSRQALDAFRAALELRPGLGFHLPVTYQKSLAFRWWMRLVLKWTAWSVLGVLFFVSVFLFYVSRPWNWLGARHAVLLVATAGLWRIVWSAAVAWLASRTDLSRDGPPIFAAAEAGSPESGPLEILFFYGLVGVFGAFVFAACTARFRLRWTRGLANAAAGLLLFASLTALFYLNHIESDADFEISKNTRFPYLKGNFRFVGNMNMTPYVLTDPNAFPYLDVSNISEPEFREWAGKHTPDPQSATPLESIEE